MYFCILEIGYLLCDSDTTLLLVAKLICPILFTTSLVHVLGAVENFMHAIIAQLCACASARPDDLQADDCARTAGCRCPAHYPHIHILAYVDWTRVFCGYAVAPIYLSADLYCKCMASLYEHIGKL